MYTTEELKKIGKILNEAKKLAIEYRGVARKPLGITSEVAEYEAAIKLKCSLCSARTPGHDLIDANNERVQVKGRVVLDKKSQRVPTIAKSTIEKPWDYVALVLLDPEYNVTRIYKASKRKIETEFSRPRPKGGKQRRNMPVKDFMRISGQPLWKIAGKN